MDGWHDFFVAQAGAAVAFAGLVLVSVSINLERILKVPGLIGRSAEPLAVLFTLFVASSLMLVPDQRTTLYGLELLVLAAAFAIVIAALLRQQRPSALDAETRGAVPRNSFRFRALLCALTAGFLIAAGVGIAFERDRAMYLTVPAMIVGFLVAFLDAWVLLIEIDR